MLADQQISCFVATHRAAEALVFYRDVLGLRFVEETDWAIIFDLNGTALRVQKAPAFTPHPFSVLGWRVRDIDAVMTHLRGRGVVFARYPFMAEGADHWTAPDGAKVAWFKDPDGNLLSLDQQV